jgi:hypothetical protein
MRILGVALVSMSLLLATGCGPEQMKPFTSAEGKFTAQMPGTPTEKTQMAAGITFKMYMVETRSGGMVVGVADMPIGANESEAMIQQRLDGARDGAVKNINGTLAGSSQITLAGKYPGRELTANLPENKGILKARIYLVGARMYQVMVLGNAAYVNSENAGKFFDSFSVNP